MADNHGVNVERETDIEMLRKKARLSLFENKRLVDEIVRVKRELLVLNFSKRCSCSMRS